MNVAEEKLTEKYPDLKNVDLKFDLNGRKIKSKMNSKENKINNGDIINVTIED